MTKKIKKDIALSVSKIGKDKTSIQNRTGKDTNVLNIDSDSKESSKLENGPNGGLELIGKLDGIETKKDEKQDVKNEKKDF